MFSRAVEHVSATKIFARGLDDGRQVLAYAMQMSAVEDVAMVLPIPVPPGSPDDAVEMIDVSAYPELFTDLQRAFPMGYAGGFGAPLSRGGPPQKALAVHKVGAFDASFVPRSADFARLDPRFRLSPTVLAALPQYADWGFVVFQLGAGRSDVHPMAFRFPRRDPTAIFFPTVHVHDGAVPATAAFDHTLYAQLPPLIAAIASWQASERELGAFVNAARAADVVDALVPGFMDTRAGDLPNEDLVLRAPDGVALADLWGAGPTYRYRVGSRYHFTPLPSRPQWHATSRAKLASLCAALRSGVAELAATHARRWQLGPLTDAPPSHYLNGDHLMTAQQALGVGVPPGGPISVSFRPHSELLEHQDITFGFSEVPTIDDAREINRALCRLLDRCVA